MCRHAGQRPEGADNQLSDCQPQGLWNVSPLMRRIAIALVVALAIPSVAQARVHKIAPPGNSGVGQYLETVPTADGGQPTNTIHPGGVGVGVGRGRTGGGPDSTSGGALTASTQRALAKQGPTGEAAAALAAATAPRRARPAAHSSGARRESSTSTSGGPGSSPSTSVLKALSGSTSGGGLGPLLPIALIGSVLAAAVLTLMRRRGTS